MTTSNVFDELKNQWGSRGYCCGKEVMTELAARLIVFNPGHHTETIKLRRKFLFMAAQVVHSRRQCTLKPVVKAD